MSGRSDTPDGPGVVRVPPREAVQRWRLVLARGPVDPDQVQRAQQAAWERTLTSSGLPVAGLDADPPKLRFANAAPLAAALPGEAELVDVWLTERLPRWRVREALADRLPDGYRLVDLYDAWLGEPPLPGQVVASVYRATVSPGVDVAAPETGALAEAASAMLAAEALPRVRRKGDTSVAYDLRPFLGGLEVVPDPVAAPGGVVVRMTLRHDPEKGLGRPEEVLGELGDRVGARLETTALVRERLVLASELPAADPPPPGRGSSNGRGRGSSASSRQLGSRRTRL